MCPITTFFFNFTDSKFEMFQTERIVDFFNECFNKNTHLPAARQVEYEFTIFSFTSVIITSINDQYKTHTSTCTAVPTRKEALADKHNTR